jgi:hypothetical protein
MISEKIPPNLKTATRVSRSGRHIRVNLREWAIIGLFSCLTVVMLFPLSVHLSSMVPEPTDPLLNSWRMQWHAHTVLGGPAGIANLFNTNIFYPFPLTLAYSEHFIMIAAQALPLLLVADSHLFGLNFSVLVTFILSGYAMYLLVSEWTGLRLAGLVAGILFAFSPLRFGQLNHLELLVTQWMPLALLALHWTLTRPGRRYPVLFILFFNLQALSGFHFGLNLAIASALLLLVYGLSRRVRWRRGLWSAGAIALIITLLLNGPVWRMYLRFSDVMGAVRTPGEVRIYSAALTDYVTAIPYNLLYGWTFGRWQFEGHQFQPLMPLGLAGLFLAVLGLVPLLQRLGSGRDARKGRRASRPDYRTDFVVPSTVFLLLLTVVALLLSFGLNENALGPALAPILKYSPYIWLYDNVAAFQGIRVPGRFGIMVVLGLTGLAGWGVYVLSAWVMHFPRLAYPALGTALIGLILIESWSAPLVGPEFPAGREIPRVYRWLRHETTPETVVVELPFRGPSEFAYEYYSSHHWRRLANGGTGFTPPIYKEIRAWFNSFPDPRSIDVMQQLGIDLVVLHPESYAAEAWAQLQTDLPLYWPAIEQIQQIDEALVLHLATPPCRPEPDRVDVLLSPAIPEGRPNALLVAYHNQGSAAFVADVQQISQLEFGRGEEKRFTEPLVTPAGESQSVTVLLSEAQQPNDLARVVLRALNRSVSLGSETTAPEAEKWTAEPAWHSLGLKFLDGPRLRAYLLEPASPTACGYLTVALDWEAGIAGDRAVLQLLDPFGRIVTQDVAQPWTTDGAPVIDVRTLPLVGSLPAGRYGLRVLVQTADGVERSPVTGEGVTIPSNMVPPLPVINHPADRSISTDDPASAPVRFDESVALIGSRLVQDRVVAGDWLRFSLVWQAEQPVSSELTVFTQLIGPEGQVWGQRDNRPGGGWYDVSLWEPGRPVTDDYAFQVKSDAPPGLYRLIVGLYHSDSLERLRVDTGSDFVEIGTVVIEE